MAPLRLASVVYMTVPTTAARKNAVEDVRDLRRRATSAALCDTITADATIAPSDGRWNVTGEPFGTLSPSPSTVQAEAGETTRLALLG